MNLEDEESVTAFLKFVEPMGIHLVNFREDWIGDDEVYTTTYDPVTPEQIKALFDAWEEAGH
jgi:hypothetical protein